MCVNPMVRHARQKSGDVRLGFKLFFYYAHHMSTIEGGMICTDDENVYQSLRMLRSWNVERKHV